MSFRIGQIRITTLLAGHFDYIIKSYTNIQILLLSISFPSPSKTQILSQEHVMMLYNTLGH